MPGCSRRRARCTTRWPRRRSAALSWPRTRVQAGVCGTGARRRPPELQPQPCPQGRDVGCELGLGSAPALPLELGEQRLQPLSTLRTPHRLARGLEAERRDLLVKPALPVLGDEVSQRLAHLGRFLEATLRLRTRLLELGGQRLSDARLQY